MKRLAFLMLTVFCSLLPVAASAGWEETPYVEFLIEGRLAEGAEAIGAHLEEEPGDAQAQYALGVTRLLQAVEGLAQDLHRYGLRPNSPRLPFVRLPVPKNDSPEKLTYEAWRDVLQRFVDNLDTASAELARVESDDVKLMLPVGMIRLDLDGDGEAGEDETFWKVFTRVAWRAAKLSNEQMVFPIGFDKADVHWMIGYTHLLRALAEAWLAHDTREFFGQTAHFFFEGAANPYSSLSTGERGGRFNAELIADAVASIHLMSVEPVEPERLRAAHGHLLAMIAQSRKCWEHALAEEDDDREWIPNAHQTSLTPLTVTDERINAWKLFLDEAEAVLEGEKLIPHWRVQDGRGINLKRVFEEPTRFDLIMWAHGAAAVPYLEEGELITGQSARSLAAAFQGRFLAFAVWFQ